MFHAVVHLDHHHAQVLHFDAHQVHAARIDAHERHSHGQDERRTQALYESLCQALQDTPEVLVTGSHVVLGQFRHYVEAHRPKLAPHIADYRPAAELLADDPHDQREHAADRELDQARDSHLLAELQSLDDALARLHGPGFGQCIDCASTIPFDRLQHQPQALRCVDCQAAVEARHA